MIALLRRLGYESLVYGLGGILTKVVGFFLLPVYTRFLAPEEYGAFSLLLVTGAIVGVIAQLGVTSALFHEVIYREAPPQAATASALIATLASGIVLLAVLAPLATQISNVVLGDPAYGTLLQLVLLSTVLGSADAVYRTKLRIASQPGRYSAFTLAKILALAALNVYMIVVLGLGVRGLVASNLIVEAVFAVTFIGLMWPDLRAGASSAVMRALLRFGVPLVPGGLAALLMTYADRYFLRYFGSTAEVGVYTVGYSIGVVVSIAVQAVQIAWAAWLFAIVKREDATFMFARLVTYYVVIFGLLALAVSVLAREALIFFAAPAYWGAYVVVPFVCLAYVFNGLRTLTNAGVLTNRKTHLVSVAVLVGLLVNTVLNLLWIPRYGMIGAAWATLIGYGVLFAVQLWMNMRLYSIPLEYNRLLKVVLAWSIVFSLAMVWTPPDLWISVLYKLSLLAVFPLLLLTLRFYRPEEIATVMTVIRRGARPNGGTG